MEHFVTGLGISILHWSKCYATFTGNLRLEYPVLESKGSYLRGSK